MAWEKEKWNSSDMWEYVEGPFQNQQERDHGVLALLVALLPNKCKDFKNIFLSFLCHLQYSIPICISGQNEITYFFTKKYFFESSVG